MHTPRPGFVTRCLAAVVLIALCGCGRQDTAFPSRPITLIVPFTAAGTTDLLSRLISERAARTLGQQIVIENRPGAGGNVGTGAAARAAPDGYTLVACTVGTCAINLAIYETLPYDIERDFTPLVLFGSISNILAVKPGLAVKDVAGLAALAKSKPGSLSYGSAGYGSSPHLAGELFRQAAGIDMVHVPYRGSAPAITDLRGGQIDLFFDNMPSILPQVRAGAVRALAVTGAKRSPLLPQVPTMEQAGYPGFVIAPWFGLLALKKTPQVVIDRLSQAYTETLRDPEITARLAEMGMDIAGGTPEEFETYRKAEARRWGDLVKSRGIRAEELR